MRVGSKRYMNKIRIKSIIAFALVVLAASTATQPTVSAVLLDKNLIEAGITQYDSRVSADTGCSETPQTVSGGITDSLNLGSDPKQRRVNLIKAFMQAYGLQAHQAAGIVGNFAVEAGSYSSDDTPGVRPDINQGESGAGAPPNSSALGYGWAQWSEGRKTAFVNFLNSNPQWVSEGRATDTADFNYLQKELTSSYQSTITELKKQTSAKDAAVSFESTFERAGVPVLDKRIHWANTSLSEYNSYGGGSGISLGSDGTVVACNQNSTGGSVGLGESAKFGAVAFPLKGSKSVVGNPEIFKNGTTSIGEHPYIAYDINAKPGTEVVAFAAGRVSYVSTDKCPGKLLTIWNEEAKLGVTYMHLSSHIAKGDTVAPGDHVGVVGTARQGCGIPHLHIDVATDDMRQPCARERCSIQDHFRSIGKDLYTTYEALP